VIPSPEEKKRLYDLSLRQVEEVVKDEDDPVAIMAAVTCILKTNLPHGFWIGFYRVDPGKPNELVIGPYQGTFGCLRIEIGKGVCGHCAEKRETVIVPDVHRFAGHIACDGRSKSEIVVPVFDREGRLSAVLDLDATEAHAFTAEDREGLEKITAVLRETL
jgi:GAF domain-containing protein